MRKSVRFAHFCVGVCVKVTKIKRHFLICGLQSCILTYEAFLVKINTDAQTVAQTMAEKYF